MKRYLIIYISFIAALLAGCTNDLADTPAMNEVGSLKVEATIAGETKSMLMFSCESQTVVVDVAINNQEVFWTPVSNQEWCKIKEEEHRGNGSFTIEIERNESFDDRATADITFVAGEYSTHLLTVDHLGKIFVINQLYSATSSKSGSTVIKIQCKADLEWTIEGNDWLTAEKSSETPTDGLVTNDITISWSENASEDSRFGKLLGQHLQQFCHQRTLQSVRSA